MERWTERVDALESTVQELRRVVEELSDRKVAMESRLKLWRRGAAVLFLGGLLIFPLCAAEQPLVIKPPTPDPSPTSSSHGVSFKPELHVSLTFTKAKGAIDDIFSHVKGVKLTKDESKAFAVNLATLLANLQVGTTTGGRAVFKLVSGDGTPVDLNVSGNMETNSLTATDEVVVDRELYVNPAKSGKQVTITNGTLAGALTVP